jgi:hypothetical protein
MRKGSQPLRDESSLENCIATLAHNEVAAPHHFRYSTLRVRQVALLSPQPAQQILRVDRLGENIEFVPVPARLFQQIGRCGLAGKQQDLD